MSGSTRAKALVPSAPAQKGWSLQSRPFVQKTQMTQQRGPSSAVHHVACIAPTRGFGGESVRDPMRPIVQPKLEFGPVDDAYEREADTAAEQAITGLSGTASELPPPLPKIQRLATVGGTAAVPPEVEAGIKHARGRGQPLERGIGGQMEKAFGADFSDVRLHTDAAADRLNRSIRALAFTVGPDIFFRSGHVCPGTGAELLVHELTHVVQQTGCADGHSSRGDAGKSSYGLAPNNGREPIVHANHRKDGLVQRLFFEGECFDEKSMPLGNLQTLIVRMKLRGDPLARVWKYEEILKQREVQEEVPVGDRWSERNESTVSWESWWALPDKSAASLPTEKLEEFIPQIPKGSKKSKSGQLRNELETELARRNEQKVPPLSRGLDPSFRFRDNRGNSGATPGLESQAAAAPPLVPAPVVQPAVFRSTFTDLEARNAIDEFYSLHPSQRPPVTMSRLDQYITENDVREVRSHKGNGCKYVGYGEVYSMSDGANWEVHVHRTHGGSLLKPTRMTDLGTSTVQTYANRRKPHAKLQLSDEEVVSLGIAKKATPPDDKWFKETYKEKAQFMGLWNMSWEA